MGDYSRRLAGELIRNGNEAAIISVNDLVTITSNSEFQLDGDTRIPVVRIPGAASYQKRRQIAESFIDKFDPDWLSLQFVPFGFHEKGLPVRLPGFLQKVGKGRRWQIMFHELWVGTSEHSAVKQKLLSYLQQRIIKKLLKKLKPAVVHTHLPVYKKNLNQLANIKVNELPLFANIPVYKQSTITSSGNRFVVGFFSQVDIQPPVLDFLIQLESVTDAKSVPLEILLIGGNEKKMNTIIGALEAYPVLQGKVTYTGFLTAQEVSRNLQYCTLGITPVYRHGVGKSGSVAAFISHGVPVAAPNVMKSHDSGEIGFFSKSLREVIVTQADEEKICAAKKIVSVASREISLPSIADTMFKDLKAASYE